MYIPFVKSSKLVLLLLIPLRSALEVVLEAKTTADGAATGQVLRDIFPLHAVTAELND